MNEKSVKDFYKEIIFSLTISEQLELMMLLYDRIKDFTDSTPPEYHESVVYVEKIRKEGMFHLNGQLKTPEEFLQKAMAEDAHESAG